DQSPTDQAMPPAVAPPPPTSPPDQDAAAAVGGYRGQPPPRAEDLEGVDYPGVIRRTVHWACARGLVPIPCRVLSKQPIGSDWGARPNDVDFFSWAIRKFGMVNIGLLLGPVGGLIDVDIDDRIKAAPTLRESFGDEPPRTLGWESERGEHYAF